MTKTVRIVIIAVFGLIFALQSWGTAAAQTSVTSCVKQQTPSERNAPSSVANEVDRWRLRFRYNGSGVVTGSDSRCCFDPDSRLTCSTLSAQRYCSDGLNRDAVIPSMQGQQEQFLYTRSSELNTAIDVSLYVAGLFWKAEAKKGDGPLRK